MPTGPGIEVRRSDPNGVAERLPIIRSSRDSYGWETAARRSQYFLIMNLALASVGAEKPRVKPCSGYELAMTSWLCSPTVVSGGLSLRGSILTPGANGISI